MEKASVSWRDVKAYPLGGKSFSGRIPSPPHAKPPLRIIRYFRITRSHKLGSETRSVKMIRPPRAGKINVRAVLILAITVFALAGGGFVAWRVRKRIIADQALANGTKAVQEQRWADACKFLRRYLEKYPNDPEILEEYARANFNVKPLEPKNVGAAIGAYRQLIRIKPEHPGAYEELATLYASPGAENFNELAYVARKRLQHAPGDPKARVWLARATMAPRKEQPDQEARKMLLELLQDIEKEGATPPEEYAVACRLLSELAMRSETLQFKSRAIQGQQWLDRGIRHVPKLSRARVWRARFLREHLSRVGLAPGEMLQAACEDLQITLRYDAFLDQAGNFNVDVFYDRLAEICRRNLTDDPQDLKAQVWLVRALGNQSNPDRKKDAARLVGEFIAQAESRDDVPQEYMTALRVLAGLSQRGFERAETPLRPGRLRDRSDRLPLTWGEILNAGRADLEHAGRLTDSPVLRVAISHEWLRLGDLDVAGDELETAARAGEEASTAPPPPPDLYAIDKKGI